MAKPIRARRGKICCAEPGRLSCAHEAGSRRRRAEVAPLYIEGARFSTEAGYEKGECWLGTFCRCRLGLCLEVSEWSFVESSSAMASRKF